MDIEELCSKFKNDEITQDAFLSALKDMRAFTRSDRFKLMTIDRAPFTMWASDENNIIRYWECKGYGVYGLTAEEAIGKDFLTLFVAEAERSQADIDAKRIIAGTDNLGEFVNNIAEDNTQFGPQLLMTNCFRVPDEDTGKMLQAEIGIPTNLALVNKKYAEIKAAYNKLQSLITEKKANHKSFLESFNLKINNLLNVALAMNTSSRRQDLLEEGIARVNSFPDELSNKRKTAVTELQDALDRLVNATTIDEFEKLETEYRQHQTLCDNLIFGAQIVLDELSYTMNYAVIQQVNDLSKQKATAIQDCDTRASGILQTIRKLILKLDDFLSNPSYAPQLSDSIRPRIELLISLRNEVNQGLTSVKQEINGCSNSEEIKTKRAEFFELIEQKNKTLAQKKFEAPI